MTSVSNIVTLSAVTGPTSHSSKHSHFNAERNQGSNWFCL